MEWLDQILKVGPQLSANGLLMVATVMLWRKTVDQQKQIDALNAARIADLQAIQKRNG